MIVHFDMQIQLGTKKKTRANNRSDPLPRFWIGQALAILHSCLPHHPRKGGKNKQHSSDWLRAEHKQTTHATSASGQCLVDCFIIRRKVKMCNNLFALGGGLRSKGKPKLLIKQQFNGPHNSQQNFLKVNNNVFVATYLTKQVDIIRYFWGASGQITNAFWLNDVIPSSWDHHQSNHHLMKTCSVAKCCTTTTWPANIDRHPSGW